jgi:hypothetical protein
LSGAIPEIAIWSATNRFRDFEHLAVPFRPGNDAMCQNRKSILFGHLVGRNHPRSGCCGENCEAQGHQPETPLPNVLTRIADPCDREHCAAELAGVVGDYARELTGLVKRLAKDAAAHVADYHLGEIPALCQRCHEVLAVLSVEADDAEDRQRRYARQQALLNVLTLCEGICRFHAGKRKTADIDALRGLIADALQPLVPVDRTE